ncbi:MAG: deoxyribose-phosphate aldolase [Eubacteriaceae bacterium]|nr:deoxyribose-phosphate aldolase [Eubacteriaceae bacterium]
MELTRNELASYIDHALLRPEMDKLALEAGLAAAVEMKVAAACVRGCDLSAAARVLSGTGVKAAAVAAFPHGSSSIMAKAHEISLYASAGADEVDFVINIGLLKSKAYSELGQEMDACVKAAHDNGAVIKAIFECCYLSEDEIKAMCDIALNAGCDFVKTSTGFGTYGARAEDVMLMSRCVAGRAKVKASGGIRTLEDAIALINAGADRLGASATQAILGQLPL